VSIRSKLLAGLLACGVSAVAVLPARAATPQCGANCLAVFSSQLGSYASPNFVEHVFGGSTQIGRPTGLTHASASDSSEDFVNPHPGTVSDYYALGLVSAQINQHYGSLTASQLEYAPLGARTGLCVGVAADPFPGEALSLQPCTVPGTTVWIIATALSPATAPAKLFPIVSGATRNFAHPFTMTYPRHVNTNRPLPPIRLRHLQLRGAAGVPGRQLWSVTSGPLH
jgi:hypothetical protein